MPRLARIHVAGGLFHVISRFHDRRFYLDMEGARFKYLDTKEFEAYSNLPKDDYVKPVLTKTWFHNGAFIKQGVISKQYETEYFHGANEESPDVLDDTVIEDESSLSTEELREAYRSMKTKTLRQEVWEAEPDTGRAVGGGPYTAAESNFIICRLQEKGDNKNAVFVVHPRETLTWHYEQNASDPRIAHEFTLQVDDYGNIEKSASVVYPRRPNGTEYPDEQEALHATCVKSLFINKDPENGAPFYLVGVPDEAQSFEVGGIDGPTDGAYLGIETVRAIVDEALDQSNIIPFEQRLSGGIQARRLTWQRFTYWDGDESHWESDPAIDHGLRGDVTDKSLLHHVETAVLTQGLLDNAYGDGTPGSSAITAGVGDGPRKFGR